MSASSSTRQETTEPPRSSTISWSGALAAPSPKGYLRALEELVARHPRFVDGHAHLGNARYDGGSFEPALESYMHGFSLCMEVLPPGFEAFIEWDHVENRPFLRAAYGIARCRCKLGRTEDGLSMLGRIVSWNPDDDQGVRFMIGSEYLRAGEEKAHSFFETEASQYPPYLYELALLHFRREDYVAAATALRAGFVENGYVAEILCGNPDPLPAGIWHGHGFSMPQTAKNYVSDYGRFWARDTARDHLPPLAAHPSLRDGGAREYPQIRRSDPLGARRRAARLPLAYPERRGTPDRRCPLQGYRPREHRPVWPHDVALAP